MRAIDLLVEVGEALHGRSWREQMPNELGVSSESIRQWINGRRHLSMDSPVLSRCKDLIDVRILEMHEEIARLNKLRLRLNGQAVAHVVEFPSQKN